MDRIQLTSSAPNSLVIPCKEGVMRLGRYAPYKLTVWVARLVEGRLKVLKVFDTKNIKLTW